MKINEILVESQQLDEGPVGDTLGKIGRGVGKVVGGVSKGVGAVAGGVAGIGKAFKKGYQSGKATVSGEPDPNAATTGQGGSTVAQAAPGSFTGKPAEPRPTGPVTGPSATDINKAGPAGTVAAKPVQGTAAKQAIAKTAQAMSGQTPDQAGQTLYAQVKSQINQLDKKGKQRLLQLLQKSMSAPQPAAAKAGAPAAGAGAFGQMAQQLAKGGAAQQPNTMANAPVSATNTAKPGNPNLAQPAAAEPAAAPAAGPGSTTAPAGPKGAPRTEPDLNAPAAAPAQAAPAAKPAAGEQPTTAAGKKKPAPRKPAAPSQAEIDADRARVMGATSDSKINTGNPLAEALAQKIEQQKQRMFEKDLMIGKTKIFKQ